MKIAKKKVYGTFKCRIFTWDCFTKEAFERFQKQQMCDSCFQNQQKPLIIKNFDIHKENTFRIIKLEVTEMKGEEEGFFLFKVLGKKYEDFAFGRTNYYHIGNYEVITFETEDGIKYSIDSQTPKSELFIKTSYENLKVNWIHSDSMELRIDIIPSEIKTVQDLFKNREYQINTIQ
jgi:hypothetical protein